MEIKHPFGNDLNTNFYGGLNVLGTMTATQTKAEYTVSSMFNYIRIATSAKVKKIKVTADDKLPAGAILMIYADLSPTGSQVVLSTGFLNDAKKGLRRIGMASAADGTGNYVASFFYNGSKFVPYSLINLTNTISLAGVRGR
jgi:hypothetical protein